MKAYLDIETDRQGQVCVIGIFCQPGGFIQFYGDDVNLGNLQNILGQAETIVTFNGDSFDLPTLGKHLNMDLKGACCSLDLLKVKRSLGLRGGLKELEKTFGIRERPKAWTATRRYSCGKNI